MYNKVYTISQLNSYLAGIMDAEELLHNIKISGEVSDYSYSGGNSYFTLKDRFAQIPCIFFGQSLQYRAGSAVILTGSPKFYVKGGKLTFSVTKIAAAGGEGELFKNFLLLKEKLQQEGLFDKKIPLPDKICRIGVITSQTGAVIHDIINVSRRRDPNIDIVLMPVKVRGIGASEEITSAIKIMDGYKKVDCIIVARGGGSIEDLEAYNTESVAHAVAGCRKFIVSAVGHETDFTLCDFCADLRAPTPSAAAELLTRDICGEISNLNHIAKKLIKEIGLAYDSVINVLSNRASALELSAERYLYMNFSKLSAFSRKLASLDFQAERGLSAIGYKLNILNPLSMINKGYAKLYKNGKAVFGVKELASGDEITISMHDGRTGAIMT